MEALEEMSIPRDMNEVRDIILGWEKGFESEEERFFYYLKHCATLEQEYWDLLPQDGQLKIKEHPWDRYDD